MNPKPTCDGDVIDIQKCKFSSQGNCGHNLDVGIECWYEYSEIRLEGQDNVTMGILEILHNEKYGTICMNNMTDQNSKNIANVACRQLGMWKGEVLQHYNCNKNQS